MDNEALHADHHRRLTSLETNQAQQTVIITDMASTMKTICSNLALLVKNTSEVVQIMQTARGLKSIVVWVSPFVLLVATIIGIVKYFFP